MARSLPYPSGARCELNQFNYATIFCDRTPPTIFRTPTELRFLEHHNSQTAFRYAPTEGLAV